MKKFIYTTGIIFILLIAGKQASAQQKDSVSVKKEQVAYYAKSLGINEDKAGQISGIQDSYKKSLQAIIAQPGLSEEAKRVKIDLLIAEKNKKLSTILSNEQLIKIVPSTELEKNKAVQKDQPRTN